MDWISLKHKQHDLLHKKSAMRTLFWYDKNKTTPTEGCISCSVILKNRESYIKTDIKLTEAEKKTEWGGNKKRFLPVRKTYHTDNARLSLIETRLKEIYDGLIVLKGFDFVEPGMITEAYRFLEQPENEGLRPDRTGLQLALEGKHNLCPTLLGVMDAHYKNKARFVAKDTLETYRTRIKNLRLFLAQNKRTSLPADEFRPVWCRKFVDWMYEQDMSTNHIARHIIFYNEALSEALEREEIETNPMNGFKVEREERKDLRHLSESQIKKVAKIDFREHSSDPKQIELLTTARDIFLFLAYTGFHISDFQGITLDHISVRKSGLWILKPRNKTKVKAFVKMRPEAVEIWSKWGGCRGIPTMHKDTINKYLKIIDQIAGLKLGLSTKIGRKTFANDCLNNQCIDKDSVAAAMGLKSTRHIEDYAEITIDRLEKKLTW